MLSDAKIDYITARANEVAAQMAENPDRETYVKLAREFSELEPVVLNIQALRATQKELADLLELIDDTNSDVEMRELAEAEVPELEERIEELEAAIQVQLLPKDIADNKNAIIEVRAGTGGDEAALLPVIFFGCMSAMRRCAAGNSASCR